MAVKKLASHWLALCLYKDADLYLLDDPLASVDLNIRNSIFKDAFCGYLKDRARIMITEAEEIPDNFSIDKIILMERGEVLFQGTYENFRKKHMQNLNGSNEEKIGEKEESEGDYRESRLREYFSR